MNITVKDYDMEKTIDEEHIDRIKDSCNYTKEYTGSITFKIDNKPFCCSANFVDFSTEDNGSKSASVSLENMKFKQFNSKELEEIETVLTDYIEEEYKENGKDWE